MVALASVTCTRLLHLSLVVSLAYPALAYAAGQDSTSVEVHGGTVTFDAGTNVSAISVHGKSSALDGHARVHQMDPLQ
jgi:hypothetical protein